MKDFMFGKYSSAAPHMTIQWTHTGRRGVEGAEDEKRKTAGWKKKAVRRKPVQEEEEGEETGQKKITWGSFFSMEAKTVDGGGRRLNKDTKK